MQQREHVDALTAHLVNPRVWEPSEHHSAVGLEEGDPGLGAHQEPIGLLLESGAEPSRQCRVAFGVVGDDRLQVFLDARMKNGMRLCHLQREPIRASSCSQVRPIDGSAWTSAARVRIMAFCSSVDRRVVDGALDVLDQLQEFVETHSLDRRLLRRIDDDSRLFRAHLTGPGIIQRGSRWGLRVDLGGADAVTTPNGAHDWKGTGTREALCAPFFARVTPPR